MALFGQGSDGRREPKSLVEFRAGRMTLSGSTVTADTRKGLVYMKMTDGLLHFVWKDRKTTEVVEDFIIFPGDAEFKRVPQCTTGRVYILRFKDSTRKFFYWMQEPKEEKDEELMKKVNDIIDNPPDPTQEARAGAHGLPPGFAGSQLQSLLGASGGRGLDQQQLMELVSSGLPMGGMGSMLSPFQGVIPPRGSGGGSGGRSNTSTATPQPTRQTQQQTPSPQQPPTARQLQLGDLQSILSSMNIPATQGGATAQASSPPEDQVSLSEVVTPDVLRPLASSPEVEQQLSPHLPPTMESPQAVLTSPQFRQALGVFGSALNSGQLGPLMTQFGLGQEIAQAATTGDIGGFAEALQGELGGEGGTGQSESQDEGVGQGEGEEDPPQTDTT